MARVIAMLNQKGGVGKTTSAVNLAAALATRGQRTCLIDLDPQAHMSLHIGLDPEKAGCTVYDLLLDPDRNIEEAVVKVDERLDAIVSETDLAAAETELAGQTGRHDILARAFSTISDRYDIVMIDCPPSLGMLTLNALAMANEVFVPMQAHFLALQGVGKLLETVGLVCQSANEQLEVTGILLCMHDKHTNLAREVVDDLESFFGEARETDLPWRNCQVLLPPIRRNIKLAEAPSFGQTIFQYSPNSHGARDYANLADGLLAQWTAAESDEEHAACGSPEAQGTS